MTTPAATLAPPHTLDSGQQAVWGALEALRTALAAPKRRWFQPAQPRPMGLYIHGGVGRGKTMLMDHFFSQLEAAGLRVRRVHFHHFLLEVHEALNTLRTKRQADPLQTIAQDTVKHLQVLCFDEFHVNDVADAMILRRLFEGLLGRVVVVATSNFAPDALYQDGLKRQDFLPFIDLLQARLTILSIGEGHDYRLRQVRDVQRYCVVSSPNDEAFQDVLEHLTQGDPLRPLVLQVKGRTLTLGQSARGVLRVDFAALCDQPLGAVDYLQLATAIQTLILTDVPRFSASEHNLVQRFITLIDVLYDQRIHLFITAAAAVEDLYPQSGRAQDFFQRTMSRLIAMQALDYGAPSQPQPGEAP